MFSAAALLFQAQKDARIASALAMTAAAGMEARRKLGQGGR